MLLPARYLALDIPNGRSMHVAPTPRLGGVGIMLGVIISIAMFCAVNDVGLPILLFVGLSMVMAISLLDDYISVKIEIRFLLHALSAYLLISNGLIIDSLYFPSGDISIPFFLAAPVSILFIMWMINLYNFMDGLDGLSGGMAVFGFATLALIGSLEGEYVFATYNAIIASASLGFLVLNYPPAKIFMGDSGSASLGFLAAFFSIWAHLENILPIWISLIIFSPFIVDATMTLVIRISKREKFWQAHKGHYFQILVESGLSRRKVVNYEYGLMLVCSLIALLSYKASLNIQVLFMFGLAVLYIVLMRYTRKIQK